MSKSTQHREQVVGGEKILCPFCSTQYTDKMLDVYNGTYGCDTGCEYVSIVVKCENCNRAVYIKGEFGCVEDDKDKKEFIEGIGDEDIMKAVKLKREY